MASRREKAPSKRMRKIALVICEGETEAGYLNLIKRWYKSPVRIVSHILKNILVMLLVEPRCSKTFKTLPAEFTGYWKF